MQPLTLRFGPVLMALMLAVLVLPAWSSLKLPQAMQLDGIPPLPDDLAGPLEKYQNVRGARLIGWVGDQGLLITTRFSETPQLHLVRQPGGSRIQLTFADDPVRFAAPGPNYSLGTVFGRDQGGDGVPRLYKYDPLSATVQQISDLPGRHTRPVWSRSGSQLAFSNNGRNGRDNDIYLLNLHTGKVRSVLQRAGTWYALDFSPDEQQLLLARYLSVNDVRLYLLTLSNGQVQLLDPDAFATSQPMALFAPDGSGIWFLSDRQSEYTSLRFRDFETREAKIIRSNPRHNITHFAISHNGTRIAFVVNEDGFDRLHMLDTERNRTERLPGTLADAGSRIYELAFKPDDTELALSLGSPSMPGDVFTLSLRRKYKLTRWTHSERGALRDQLLPDPEVIRYPTFDSELTGQRRLIPALYYKPAGEGPHPVVIWVHGGPESQARPTFNATLYYMLNELGLAVLRPNIRGSTGYSRNFTRLDNSFRREEALRDVGSLLDWISSQSDLDYRRVGIMGGSYGGYVALATMLRYGRRITAGVTLAPISDFITFLEQMPEYLRDNRRQEYGDERDPQQRAFLSRISPRRQISQLKSPLLIVQGANDPRVAVEQTDSLVAQIRRNNGRVWYLKALNEGHGFFRKSNHDFYQAVLGQFWRKHLLGLSEDLPEEDPSL